MSSTLDVSTWKAFPIGELFTIERPESRNQLRYLDGDIPFVASSSVNNGVTKMVSPKPGENLDVGNCITVSPLDGSAFYQRDSFLGRGGAGSAIIILRNSELNELRGLFVATSLRKSLTRFSYSDQISSRTIAGENVNLPVAEDGSPNWKLMEEYMRIIMNEAEIDLGLLERI